MGAQLAKLRLEIAAAVLGDCSAHEASVTRRGGPVRPNALCSAWCTRGPEPHCGDARPRPVGRPACGVVQRIVEKPGSTVSVESGVAFSGSFAKPSASDRDPL
jgi:hypothetical protein